MRVVHVAPTYFERDGVIGGGERYPLELARAMADEVHTELISFSHERRIEKQGSLTVHLFKPWFFANGLKISPIHLPFLKALRSADVIHCYQLHTLSTSLSLLAARLLRKRVFVTDLGGGGWDLLSYHFNMTGLVHAFLHISSYGQSLFPKGVGQHSVIYGGVDEKKFHPAANPRDRRVLYVGRLLPHKGVNYLIEAVEPETELTIIGRPYSEDYLRLLHGLAAGRNVKFIHDADDETLLRHYRNASVLVLPSVYQDVYGKRTEVPELLGLVVLEAMACATPVIVSDVASLPELVVDGVTGRVVAPNSAAALRAAIAEILEDTGRARALGNAGYLRFRECFTWDRIARRVLRLYET